MGMRSIQEHVFLGCSLVQLFNLFRSLGTSCTFWGSMANPAVGSFQPVDESEHEGWLVGFDRFPHDVTVQSLEGLKSLMGWRAR